LTHDSGLCTSNKKWIKTKMKTLIHFNSKGIEVITYYSFSVWSCFLLNSHHRCICYHCRCSLRHICANWINNDNVHQGLETIYANKDIHLSLNVVKEKVGDLHLNMCSTFQNNSCNNIPKCILSYCMFIPPWAPKQMGT
jgi:hypothetical protein